MRKLGITIRNTTALFISAVALACCKETPQEIAAEELRAQGILPTGYEAELLNATVRNDVAMLQLLIMAGAPVHMTAPDGETLLHLAARKGQAEVGRALILAGLSVERADQAGITSMQRAILHQHLHLPGLFAAATLEKQGITPDSYTEQLTECCLSGDFYTAHLIQTAGVSLDAANTEGSTALHRCAEAGQADAVRYLLKRGADAHRPDACNKTPLEAATEAGQHETRAVLAAYELQQSGISAEQYRTALLHAVQQGDTARVTLLHYAGADLQITDEVGNTLLHLAAMHRHTPMIVLLHKLGADVNARNTLGLTPLHAEIDLNHEDNIILLAQLGADIHACLPDGRNPLQFAVTEGYYRCIVPLAQAGANINRADSNGNTLLHYCAAHDQQFCLQALLQAGADVHARNGMKWTALHYACTKKAPACAKILIEHGAVDDIFTAIIADDADLCRRYLRAPSAINKTDGLGCTPLHWAARLDRRQLCTLLLEHGADATATDTRDRTAGDCARAVGYTECMQQLASYALKQRGCSTRYTDELHKAIAAADTPLLRLLIDAGADLHTPDKAGWPVLHQAVQHNHAGCLPYLLKHGAEPQATATSYTALHLAVATGKADCVKALLAAGVDADTRMRCGSTALHLAARMAQHDCLQHLIDGGANVHLRNERGDTPLLELARWNWSRPESASALLAAGADVRTLNIMGENALHAAAISGNKACLALFLTAGADTKSTTRAGKTPLQLAKSNGHKDCEHLLLEAEQSAISANN